MAKKQTITIQGVDIALIKHNEKDFISLSDMCKGFDGGTAMIEKWMQVKNTLEYLGAWEKHNNENFNSPEFGGIRNDAGSNRFYISIKKWIERTSAIGIIAKAGRYGGTYAHSDIAMNFASYLSPEFNLYINTEFQRLKREESGNLEWNVRRVLSKVNYKIHTDAVKEFIIPKSTLPDSKKGIEYAKEEDILNLALFGCTSK